MVLGRTKGSKAVGHRDGSRVPSTNSDDRKARHQQQLIRLTRTNADLGGSDEAEGEEKDKLLVEIWRGGSIGYPMLPFTY